MIDGQELGGQIDKELVNSENFIQYLLNREDRDSHDFPQKLNLGQFSDYFEQIHSERITVPYFNEERRSEINESLDKLQSAYPNTKLGSEIAGELLAKKGDAERTGTIYYDIETQQIGRSTIEHGDHASVLSQSIPLLLDDKVPLIDIHTHPNNDFFSPQDYASFFVNIFPPDNDTKARLTGANMVIAADYQYLAVPTKKTPLAKSDEERTQFIDELDAPMENEKGHIEHLKSRSTKLWNHLSNYPANEINKLLSEISKLDAKVANGEMSHDEAMIEAKSMKPHFSEELETYMKRLTEIIIRANKMAADYGDEVVKRSIYRAPKEIGVILYRATDFKTFEKFDPEEDTSQTTYLS